MPAPSRRKPWTSHAVRGFALAVVLCGLLAAAAAVASAGGPADANETTGNVTVENVSILTAPRESIDELDSRRAVATARAEERLVPTNTLVAGDALVVRFESDRFDDVLAARNGSTSTAQFRSLLAESGTVLRFRQMHPSPSERREGLAVNPASVPAMVDDHENGTYYVVVDSAAVDAGWWKYEEGFVLQPEDHQDIGEDQEWATNLTVSNETLVTSTEDGNRTASAQFQTVEPDFDFGTKGVEDPWIYFARQNLSIPVWTTFSPGTVVTVNVTSESGAHLGTKSVRARHANRARPYEVDVAVARPSFVLSGDTTGQVNVTASARSIDRSATVAVVDPPLMSLEDDADPADGDVVARDVTVPEGGFVAVYEGTGTNFSSPDRYLGASEYLAPGEYDAVTVPIEDANASGTVTAVLYYTGDEEVEPPGENPYPDYPYRVNGAVVSASGTPSTATPSPTSTAPETSSTQVTTSSSDTTSTGATDGTGPGLTAVTTLLGLVACGLLAFRLR